MMRFLEDLSPEERKQYAEQKKNRLELAEKQKQLEAILNNSNHRYRCEQINVTTIDDIPKSNSIIRTQFNLGIDYDSKLAKVKLEDYIYTINPSLLNIIFDFIKYTEFIKHDVRLRFGENGKIAEILNTDIVHKQWKNFLNSEEFETEFIRKLRNQNPDTLNQIIDLGNKQFALNSKQEEDYRRELFYTVVFDRYLLDTQMGESKVENFDFLSILIPGTIIPIKYESIISTTENNDILKFTKKGTPIISDEKKAEIKEKYDKYQKPEIQYSFTEYYLESNIEVDFDKKSRLPISASLVLSEGVKHNIESKCHFKLRKLE